MIVLIVRASPGLILVIAWVGGPGIASIADQGPGPLTQRLAALRFWPSRR